MKNKNIRSITGRRFKQTINSNHTYGLVNSKLSQDFRTTAHDQAWISDITYIRTGEGW